MIAWIIQAILTTSRDLWKIVRLLAGMAVLASKQVYGFFVSSVLVYAKRVACALILAAALWSVASTFISAVVSLIRGAVDIAGFDSALKTFVPALIQGPLYAFWEGLAIDDMFYYLQEVFATWIAGWAYYRLAQWALIVESLTRLRSFWR